MGPKNKKTDKKVTTDDKLRETILSLGGTKGDVKFLENVDTDDNDNLETNASGQDEVDTIQT